MTTNWKFLVSTANVVKRRVKQELQGKKETLYCNKW